MRLGAGDAVLLFNGRDGEWEARVAETGRRRASLTVERRVRPQAPEPDPWLAFAPIKRGRLDLLVEKAVELGAARLIPVLTGQTAAARVNVPRLKAIAAEAAEQCGRLSVPEIAEPAALESLVAGWPGERRLLVLDESGGGRPIAEALAGAAAAPPAPGFLVGPEGGFRASELDLLRRLPFVVPVSLGPRVLRAETAAVAALACWQALAGDWRADGRRADD
jgi:16S rRNA (uracil1498-N3)-methyltransferase